MRYSEQLAFFRTQALFPMTQEDRSNLCRCVKTRTRRTFYLKSNKIVNTTLANSLLHRLHRRKCWHGAIIYKRKVDLWPALGSVLTKLINAKQLVKKYKIYHYDPSLLSSLVPYNIASSKL